jgi:hypothetical protein
MISWTRYAVLPVFASLLVFFNVTAQARVYKLSSRLDDTTTGKVNLRTALLASLTNQQFGRAKAGEAEDVIDARRLRGTIHLTSELPSIGESVTIIGSPRHPVTISADSKFRIFAVTTGSLHLVNVTLANGVALGGNGVDGGGGGAGLGGALLIAAGTTVTLQHVRLQDNAAVGGNGSWGSSGGGGGIGGNALGQQGGAGMPLTSDSLRLATALPGCGGWGATVFKMGVGGYDGAAGGLGGGGGAGLFGFPGFDWAIGGDGGAGGYGGGGGAGAGAMWGLITVPGVGGPGGQFAGDGGPAGEPGGGGAGLGGAIFVCAGGCLDVVDSTFSGNIACGGVAGPPVQAASIYAADGTGHGAALHAMNGSSVHLHNVTFDNNDASHGAGYGYVAGTLVDTEDVYGNILDN